MSRSYIPSKDADLALWALNFDAVINANPATYFLTAGDSATIHTYVAAFNAALTTVRDPATNTLPNVADKDAKKAAMLDIVRAYAVQISTSAGISNDAKAAVGVTIRDTTPTPVPPPSTQPLLALIGATPNQMTLTLADAATPTRRSKPTGAIGAQLFCAIQTTVATSPSEADFLSFASRTPFVANFNPADVGKKATFFARWQNAKGEVGPWSSPVSMTIAG